MPAREKSDTRKKSETQEVSNAQDNRPPERVQIGVKLAIVRSGPGRDYYPTDALPAGDWITIVKEQGDWLAIVPPAESFCWVEGDKIQWQGNGRKGRVLIDRTPAWIGSTLVIVDEHVFQTELGAGDEVEVLDVKSIGKSGGRPEDQRRWLKIRPPQGDLRWVEKQVLTRSKKDRLLDSQSASTGDQDAENRLAAAGGDLYSEPSEDRSDSWFPRWAGHRLRSEPTQRAGLALTGGRRVSADFLSDRQWTDGNFDDRCVWLHVHLSKAAAHPAGVKDLDCLATAAQQLCSQAATSQERHRAQQLLARVEEIQELIAKRARLEDMALRLPPVPADEAIGRGLRADQVKSPATAESDNQGAAPSETPYIAEGWLMPVASLQRPAPPYVVMDAEGQPITFVTPAPGLNLRRYIDRRVGIVGQRSFAVLEKPHVIAHRVVQLDGEQTDGLFPARQ